MKTMYELRDKAITIGVNSLTSEEMSHEEITDLVDKILESFQENSEYYDYYESVNLLVMRTLDKMLEKAGINVPMINKIFNLKQSYEDQCSEDFSTPAPFDEIINLSGEVNLFNTIQNTPPERVHDWFKNAKSEGAYFSDEIYKVIMERISTLYDTELEDAMSKLGEDVNVFDWIKLKKAEGIVISDKIWGLARDIMEKHEKK